VVGLPDAAVKESRERVRSAGGELWADWERRLASYRQLYPDAAAELEQTLAGELPEGWDRDLPRFDADEKGLATRKASGKVIQTLAARIPQLVGGSADLTGSNNVRMNDFADFRPHSGEGAPRNVWWGVREHGMAAAVNGMALHGGVVPFGATFLIFSDYMRPSLRLAALMNVPTRYVFTHDSIGLGEDGPTHQPIEQLAALRAIPGFTVVRPCDANEVRECWKLVLSRPGPAALVLTRQNVPTLDRSRLAPAEEARRGGYVLADAEGGDPQVVLVATGSEVHIALEGRARLAEEGIRARVVSMPSCEVFAEQPQSYHDEALPPSVKARVVVEAATRFGWERWVGPDAGFVTLERFGASAPYQTIYEKLGITADRVAQEAKRQL
ncbi:MAG: transketolase-like TK C-terminal-containing protein, partial [Polyangiales bacterium]